MPHVNLLKLLVYSFFFTLLLQNSFGLALSALGIVAPAISIFLLKDLLMALLPLLAIFLVKRIKFGLVDKVSIGIALAVLVFAIFKFQDFNSLVFEIRFYLVPILLFFVGRNLPVFTSTQDVRRFILTLSWIYGILGLVYFLLSRELLQSIGMGDLLVAKLSQFGREDAMFRGYPVNFYFFSSSGDVYERAFGPFFDPLATAFFGATLFTYLIGGRLEGAKSLRVNILIVLVAFIVIMTLTRSIIFGVVIASIVVGYRSGRLRLNKFTLSIFVLSIIYLVVNFDIEGMISGLDPSTISHAAAYSEFDLESYLIGNPDSRAGVRGAESLYLTIVQEHGLLLLVLYLAWFSVICLWFYRRPEFAFSFSTILCSAVYALASFTTEHWFGVSSCGLFWFLIGSYMSLGEGLGRNASWPAIMSEGNESHSFIRSDQVRTG